MLYMFGPTAFTVAPLNTDHVTEAADTPFVDHSVAGAAPVYEFTGDGEYSMTLKGAAFPEVLGGLASLATLESLRASGQQQQLMRGDGKLLGWYILKSISKEHEYLNPQGIGRAISYTLKLLRSGQPDSGGLASILSLFTG